MDPVVLALALGLTLSVFCGVDMRVDKLDREVNRWLADGR
jgi:hypothetical protein